MELTITAFYCLCDDFLISEGWRDDQQCAMSTAEVMTAALTAAAFFSGSHEKSCGFLEEHGYICHDFQKVSSAAYAASLNQSDGAAQASCHAVSHDEFIENLSRGQLSCPCLPKHPHTALQNISGRMLPGTCFKPEGILLRAASSCAHYRIRNSCRNISVSKVIFRHRFSLGLTQLKRKIQLLQQVVFLPHKSPVEQNQRVGNRTA